MQESCVPLEANGIWQPAATLSERVRRLREEYFSFRERDYFRNEIKGFTKQEANTLAGILDSYNNGTLCVEGVPEG